ncbi:large ribosomal subunit protein mL38-like [Liolophura sinensis]|uniref:large ribosomal subunit protein mL38-like n=1 Tax=Liolophura sinensis TaxID=3198878 RepID=UPI00315915F2
MAAPGCMWRKLYRVLTQPVVGHLIKQPVRHGWTRLVSRGKSPEDAKSLAERLSEIEAVKANAEINRNVNIGFPSSRKTVSRKVIREWKSQRKAKERLSRLGTLSLPEEDVKLQYEADEGLISTRVLAEHYGIFRDLFDGAHFVPNTRLEVSYNFDDEFILPVYRGNKLEASLVHTAPCVEYTTDPASLWTLILTNPDGHLQDNSAEVLHWFIGNIPGCDVSKGETVCNYLAPFPPKGTGFHRYVFILFQQERKLDFSSEKRSENSTCLRERTFQTLEFYRQHQEQLTPSGLAFFQAEWDESVTDVFRNVLGMGEPSFEFVHPPVYHPKQVKYPHKQPFNLYLDRYRDVKDLREEVLREKLKMISPFSPHPKRPAYPNIYRLPRTCPQWLKDKITFMRLRKKQWSDLP